MRDRDQHGHDSRRGAAVTTVWTTVFLAGALVFALAGCQTISPYNAQAYDNAVTLKVRSLSLMAKATEPYEEHAAEVEALLLDVEIAYEYAKGLDKNEIVTRQWEILKDPERRLLGGFLNRWQSRGSMSAVFIEEVAGIVSDAFDAIIELEDGKRRDDGAVSIVE